MIVVNRTSLSPAKFTAIQKDLPHHQNLQQVMAWALADKSGAFMSSIVSQVVVQDEFSHDVVVPWQGMNLVYDAT